MKWVRIKIGYIADVYDAGNELTDSITAGRFSMAQ